jgi:hypothetical protein
MRSPLALLTTSLLLLCGCPPARTGQRLAHYLGGEAPALTLLPWPGRTAETLDPRVAVDPQGAAVVVWVEPSEDHWEVWAQRRTPVDGWLEAARVSDGSQDGAAPVVAVDAAGAAWAAWCQWDGTDASIWAARLMPEVGWGTPLAIDTRPGYSCAPRLAVNPVGDAVVVWGRQLWGPDRRTDVWASRLTAGQAWRAPELLSDQVDWADGPEVVLSPAGEATVAWNKMIGMRLTLWTSSAPAGGGFSTPLQLSVAGRDVYGQISLAGDPAGRVVALWGQTQEGVAFVPWAARRDAVGGWGEAVQVGDAGGDAYMPTAALGSGGAGLAAWKQGDGTRYQIHAARLDPVSGWGAPVALEQGSGDADYPSAAVDAAGDGMVAWSQFGAGTVFIRANRFFAGQAWQGASDEQAVPALLPAWMGFYPLQLGMNAAGLGVVVWSEDSM